MMFQADQRFVWNGNLLRELAAQPEVARDLMVYLFLLVISISFLLNAFN